ncbi:MAG: alpha/beta fold hydrolase [Hyphomicrobiaceae bacterium]|nr:MAG: alpha/beta fold hydrolase [Hyphomicrobiaceae bacterium]
MKRGLRSIAGLLLAVACLAGCAARPTPEALLPVANVPDTTSKVKIIVATTRAPLSGQLNRAEANVFTANRSEELNHAAVTVSIPRQHAAGKIEWADQLPPNPSRHFAVAQRTPLQRHAFLEEVRASARANGGSVLVFIHGYNTLYEESVFRFAQIVHDSGYKGAAVLFAWPSRGKPTLYLADREAANYSRDYLEGALLLMAGLPEVKEINILAHSMGTWIAVEALRQAKMKGHGNFRGKLAEVLLASPDIDATVFRTQLDVIGPLRQPMTVFVSGDDKALSWSRTLAGNVPRVGTLSLNDPRVADGAKKYHINVVDMTAIKDGSGLHHSKFAQSNVVVATIGKALAHGPQADEEKQPGVVKAVVDVGESIMKVPQTIMSPAAN